MTADLRAPLQTTLGSAYVLERDLGGGGMSRLFLADEVALGRYLAGEGRANDDRNGCRGVGCERGG